jgi:hypothetical protein
MVCRLAFEGLAAAALACGEMGGGRVEAGLAGVRRLGSRLISRSRLPSGISPR